MKLTEQDPKGKRIKLRIENIDDLWHIYNLVGAGDHVFMYTQRREEKAADRIREKRGEKRTLFLGIRVEKLDFQPFSDRLRIHGIILPEQLDSGSFHTLNLEQGNELTVEKEDWGEQDLKRIHEAVEASKIPKVIVVSLDEDEALIAILRQYGVQEVATVNSGRGGKQYHSTPGKDVYFEEITDIVMQQGTGLPMIIAGPGFTKENILKFGRTTYPEVYALASTFATGQVGKVGINEILKSGAVSRVTEGTRIEMETRLIERFLTELSTSGKAAYGFDEVRESVKRGAAEIVLITEKILRERRREAEEMLRMIESSGMKMKIISDLHDGGKQLQSLGGYAAILRYKFH